MKFKFFLGIYFLSYIAINLPAEAIKTPKKENAENKKEKRTPSSSPDDMEKRDPKKHGACLFPGCKKTNCYILKKENKK